MFMRMSGCVDLRGVLFAVSLHYCVIMILGMYA